MGLLPFVIFWRRSKSPMVVIDNVKLLIVYYIFCDIVTNMVTDIVTIALLLALLLALLPALLSALLPALLLALLLALLPALLPALLLFIQSPRTKVPFWLFCIAV